MIKRILKWLGIGLLVLILAIVIAIPVASKKRPVGTPGPEADAMARKMQQAVQVDKWNEIRFVKWNFLGQHDFLWDKFANIARVEWGPYQVYIDGGTLEGKVTKNGEVVSGEAKEKVMAKATENFFNDAFWLNAPAKVFDEGVIRSTVEWKGEKALLITYSSGGLTPGDGYLWFLHEDGTPRGWKMWVDILPLKGLGNSWDGWTTLYNGAKISTVKGGGPFNIEMIRNLDAGNTLGDVGEDEDALAQWRFEQ